MFGMGWFEILFILVLALVVLGPEKLPKIARTAGKALRQLRRATSDLRQAIDIEGMRDDMRLQLDDNKKRRDPYAGLAAEEARWSAEEDTEVFDEETEGEDSDDIPIHRDHADLYSAPPGAVEAAGEVTEMGGEGWARDVSDTVSAAPVSTPVLDPHTVHVAPIDTPELAWFESVETIEVEGGITALLQALSQRAPDPEGPFERISLPSVSPQDGQGVTIRRSPVQSPPIELLGGVVAVPIGVTTTAEEGP